MYYSQYGQDKWLDENIFRKKVDGFFLEIGADDGIDKSNTLFFEEKGWNGICIEPSPERYKLLKKNRACSCINVAISDSIELVNFLDIKGWGKGLSGIIDSYNDEHKNRIKFELTNPQNKGSEIIKVKTNTIKNILNPFGIKNIDFCSIDVEGSEMKVLKSIDFSATFIKVIMIENNYSSNNVNTFLLQKGYDFLKKIEVDDIYILK